ncbi:MAG: hypothetical protein ACM3U2_09935 [Deltaproteobacteria bacterium]
MFSTDIAGDSLVFDGGIAVTLNQKRAGVVTPVTVRSAASGPLTSRQREALGAAGIVGTERQWSLNAADVGSAGVQPGDSIDDGTSRWTVLSAELATLGARWRCVTRKQL